MTRTYWFVTLSALLALGGAARADDGPCKTPKPPAAPSLDFINKESCSANTKRQLTPEQRIKQKLLEHYDLNWKDTPLRQVIDDLHALTDINVVPDTDALREAGVDLEQPLMLKVEDMSLKSALNILLKQARLTYVIKDEALQITTAECPRRIKMVNYPIGLGLNNIKMVTVTYPVADLITPIGSGENELPPFVCRRFPEMAGKRTTCMTAEAALIRLITSTIAPNSWADASGPGTIKYFPIGLSLVVNQIADVQEQIADLLAALRREQANEDRQEVVTARVITRTANGDEVVQLPKTTVFRGQRFTIAVGDSVAIRTGTIRDCLRTGSAGEEAQEEGGVRKPAAQARNGLALTVCVTKAPKGKLRLDATFEKSEISEATPTGLRVTGQTCRLIQQVESGSSVKMVLSHDENGKPRSWVMMTVTELPVEEEETIFLGALPPIPR